MDSRRMSEEGIQGARGMRGAGKDQNTCPGMEWELCKRRVWGGFGEGFWVVAAGQCIGSRHSDCTPVHARANKDGKVIRIAGVRHR